MRANGNLDRRYGRSGFAQSPRGFPGKADTGSQGVSIAQPSGAIIFAGFKANNRLLLTRISPGGEPDRRFGKRTAFGKATVRPSSIVSDGRGGFVIGATSTRLGRGPRGEKPNAVVLHLNRRGGVDPRFGTRGYRLLKRFGHISERDDRVQVAVDGRGRILAAANTLVKTGKKSSFAFGVTRLRKNGGLDRRFGRRGTTIFDPGGSSNFLTSIAAARGGRPIVGGSLDRRALLLRLR